MAKKWHFSTIFLLSSYMKLNFMYLTNYLESLKWIQKLPTYVCYAGKVISLKRSRHDPVYGQSSSGTRFTTKMVWNVTWVVRPVQKHFFRIFIPLCMVANAFRPGKNENKNHFDLKCQESLVHWTSRWVISCKIIKKSRCLSSSQLIPL